ncbi:MULTISPECIES: Tfp pilus assembly protein FimT/FimU [unclassified Psychrobacter]|uniref:pilus assembly FimT family protein n=1 Tax=unclassified Psychrobacter TaxID=196806 RepID=UPI00070A1FB2|nr:MULTISPECIES: prepilin-type N-terminal cleavage/methylation domain-containing protein [unclassified Psychrobacter]KRG35902.1 pilus assembly protein [Psychrobacter sp. P11G3]MDX2373808.1 prepilin-type N-terminal cleavage/methylation domain-containing protein [Psychrobacter sp. PP-21]
MNASVNNRQPNIRVAHSGFTLIELMVTIAVLAIIVSIAAPSISTQLANQRVKSTASIIESALKEAKAESIIRRQNITVRYETSGTSKKIDLHTGITNTSSTNISSHNISEQSVVSITPATVTTVVFQPNKLIAGDDEILYSICDSGSTNETLGQVRVNKIANINTTNTGGC